MGDLVIPAGFFHCGRVEGISEAYGLVNERRVLKELVRRKIPFQHSVQIGDYEVDFLVGKRIIIEVDGYVHALRDTIAKDASKEAQLQAEGFIILRITGSETKNKGILREFGAKVQRAYEEDVIRFKEQEWFPLKHTLPRDELEMFKLKLEQEQERELEKTLEQKQESKKQEKKQLSEEELFLQAIANLGKSRKK